MGETLSNLYELKTDWIFKNDQFTQVFMHQFVITWELSLEYANSDIITNLHNCNALIRFKSTDIWNAM